MQLSLGPVLYNWAPERWRDFYFRIADEAPVDVVSVGEIVCSKRSPFFAGHIPAVVERLQKGGKQVLLGSLILVSQRRERRQTAELAAAEDVLVEVNDLTCLRALAGRPHAIGPFVNIYNEASAAFHAARGATRICLPPELPLSSVAAIARSVPDVMIEVFSFGRVPLAISARCYHARLHKLAKDNCRFVCEKDPDGLLLNTLEQQEFLTINGVQTLSHTAPICWATPMYCARATSARCACRRRIAIWSPSPGSFATCSTVATISMAATAALPRPIPACPSRMGSCGPSRVTSIAGQATRKARRRRRSERIKPRRGSRG